MRSPASVRWSKAEEHDGVLDHGASEHGGEGEETG